MGSTRPASTSPPAIISSIAIRASPIACRRCFASFFKQRCSKFRIAGEVLGGSRAQSGSLLIREANVSVTVSPAKTILPVSISKNTQPKAQISVRRSAAFPFACSGDMYAAVPRIIPA